MNEKIILTIFGGTGDLSKKKIIPALYNLFENNNLPKDLQIIVQGRKPYDNDTYKNFIKESLDRDDVSHEFTQKFVYLKGDLTDRNIYKELVGYINLIDPEDSYKKIFYFSILPELYKDVVENLATIESIKNNAILMIEKPFGRDYKTAIELNNFLIGHFSESQILRIDHYLEKDILQEIMIRRFESGDIQRYWDNDKMQKVEITTNEVHGLEDRGVFYDNLGALKDIGQNHLLEAIGLIFMDKPNNFSDEIEIRRHRLNAIKKIHRLNESEVLTNTFRAQHNNYRQIIGVKPESKTETYFKIKTWLESNRELEIFLEGGKSLSENKKEVNIHFEESIIKFTFAPFDSIEIMFKNNSEKENILIYKGEESRSQYVKEYSDIFVNAFHSKKENFVGIDEILESWKFTDSIANVWAKGQPKLEFYEPGTIPDAGF